MGSKEIAKGTTAGYKSFVYQIILCAVYTIIVGVISCITAVVPYAKGRRLPLRPRGTPLPDSPHLMAPRGRYAQAVGYHWGESACFYATEEGCATLYDHIYSGERSPNISLLPRPSLTFSRCSASTSHISSGDNGLGESFVVFAFVAFANTSFVLLKAGCYATLDFDFMATASLASLILVFTPALLIAIYCFDSSVAALYIAMCAPTPRHTHTTRTRGPPISARAATHSSPYLPWCHVAGTRRTLPWCHASARGLPTTCGGCYGGRMAHGRLSMPMPPRPQRPARACRRASLRPRLPRAARGPEGRPTPDRSRRRAAR